MCRRSLPRMHPPFPASCTEMAHHGISFQVTLRKNVQVSILISISDLPCSRLQKNSREKEEILNGLTGKCEQNRFALSESFAPVWFQQKKESFLRKVSLVIRLSSPLMALHCKSFSPLPSYSEFFKYHPYLENRLAAKVTFRYFANTRFTRGNRVSFVGNVISHFQTHRISILCLHDLPSLSPKL